PNGSYHVEYWYLDGQIIQAGGSNLFLPNIQASHSVTLTFADNAAAQSTVATDKDKLSICLNDTAQVTATGAPAPGDPATPFDWQKDFTGIADADKGDLTIAPVNAGNKSTATLTGTKVGRV